MLKGLIYEYCNESSIHGMRYLADKRKSVAERAIWGIFLAFSIGTCCCFTFNLYTTAQRSSIVMTISNRPRIVTNIQFPAITICSTVPFNVSKIELREIFKSGQLETNLNDFEADEMLRLLSHYCNIPDSREGNVSQMDYVQTLIKANLRIGYLKACRFGIEHSVCLQDFQEVITNLGVCYAYNSLSSHELFRSHNGKTYDFSTNLVQIQNSSKRIKNILGTYERGRIDIKFKINSKTFENDCKPRTQGFQVAFRSPRDVVVMNSADLQIKEDYATDLSLKPNVLETGESLKSFRIEERECYFEDERQLFFMRYYTQENCHLECLTNRTLDRCGCVYYYMPRLKTTKVCAGKDLMKCAHSTQQDYDNVGIGPCRCYDLCNSVTFQVDVVTNKLNLNAILKVKTGNFTETRIGIFTKVKSIYPLYRSSLYGFNDYVANFGGLLGLFLGVSILSIIELLYYMTIRPVCLWVKCVLKTRRKITNVQPIDKTQYCQKRGRLLKDLRYDDSKIIRCYSVYKNNYL